MVVDENKRRPGSSEKVFWRKVLEIYATSIDYDARAEASQRFFATVHRTGL